MRKLILSIAGPQMMGSVEAALPNCQVNSDCIPLCRPSCRFCACIAGICFRGCNSPPAKVFVFTDITG
ncbi:hypothetical protein PHJA_002283300 [Phtheirospermum japonicum]|uniref:Uncharacterized protein n=1 Tax=Phtheirospermum japonicum TaxID=374723 RepID=A0A830CZT4_9LAMI|nr:hypothetical protein PHJA_002283300 [Phtheirospermum japonicum]